MAKGANDQLFFATICRTSLVFSPAFLVLPSSQQIRLFGKKSDQRAFVANMNYEARMKRSVATWQGLILTSLEGEKGGNPIFRL